MLSDVTSHPVSWTTRTWRVAQRGVYACWNYVRASAKRPRSTLYICYALIALYAIPLIVIAWVLYASAGFTRSDAFVEYGIALATLYAAETRETLATFVMPFVTAYAVANAQRDGNVPARTLCLFFTLVLLFVLAVIVYCAVTTRIEHFLGQSDVSADIVAAAKNEIPEMCKLYLKELLVYISLTIGIAQSGSASRPVPAGSAP